MDREWESGPGPAGLPMERTVLDFSPRQIRTMSLELLGDQDCQEKAMNLLQNKGKSVPERT
jgi:hypothetical protein